MTEVALWRRLLAELLGSAFLAAVVIGSGIAAQHLSPGATGLELLENAVATAAGLFAIILMFGPVSGAHFNPVVSFVDAAFGGLRWRRIDVAGRKLLVSGPGGHEELLAYDKLVVGTGAVPVRPPIGGLDTLGPDDGVYLLHSMGDTFAVTRTLEETAPASAVIVGAGYIGLEMADALTTRGLQVIQMEQLPEVLPRPLSAPWSTASSPTAASRS